MALAAAPTDPLAVDVLFPGGQLLFSARGAAIRVAGAWPPLRRLAPPTSSSGADTIGSFEATSAKYTAAGTLVELSVRRYAGASAVAFEQRFPHGLDAGIDPAPSSPAPQPLAAFPCLSLATASGAVWRSWHGHWGSFTGVGLRPNNSLVFNGVPTMPLLFLPANRSGGGGGGVMVAPLANFTEAAHAADAETWRHGPNGRITSLPAGHTHTTLLVASAAGPTATISAWGRALRAYHRTDRAAAREADVTLRKLGLYTDNGAFLNYNKLAGNARRPLPAGATAEGALRSTLASLRAQAQK